MKDLVENFQNAQKQALALLMDANHHLAVLMDNRFVSDFEKRNIAERIYQNEMIIEQYKKLLQN